MRIHSTHAFKLRARLVEGRLVPGERIRVGGQHVDPDVLDRMHADPATRPYLRAVRRGKREIETVINPTGWVTVYVPDDPEAPPVHDVKLDPEPAPASVVEDAVEATIAAHADQGFTLRDATPAPSVEPAVVTPLAIEHGLSDEALDAIEDEVAVDLEPLAEPVPTTEPATPRAKGKGRGRARS